MKQRTFAKQIIFSLFFLIIGSLAKAQQTPLVSQYMFNPMAFNPSYAGSNQAITASALHRQQWYGMENNPATTIVSVDAPVRVLGGGVGLVFVNDVIGLFKNTSFQLAYNYKLNMGSGILAMGLDGGFTNISLALKDLRPPTSESDPTLDGKSEASKFLFQVGASANYRVEDQYEVGIALGNINQPQSSDIAYSQKRCLQINGSYVLELDMLPSIEWVPSTLVRTDFTAFQMDLSLIGMYNKQYWGGLSYRVGDAAVLMGGLFIKQVQIGLAYDLATNWMSKASKIGGGFELFLKYNFNLSVDRLPRSYKNSRYL